jgi:GDP-6-deoxy-D-talose 4-dehydrogenase
VVSRSEGAVVKRILITGSTGFTGRYVAAELAAHGWEVWGTGQRAAAGERYLAAALADVDALKRVIDRVEPHVVIHLAAVAFVGHGDPLAFYQTNLLGTRNLLVALASASAPPSCVVLASSANVYGNSAAGVLDEDAPLNPANDYAVSKLAMEYMARLWQDELPIVLVRPFNYTGAGQAESYLLPKIVAHFRRRADVMELGNLDIHRDFSDVRAVAEAYRRLVEAAPRGATVNIASGRIHSLREVLEMAERITGHHVEIKVNPALVRSNEVKVLAGNPGKLRSLIGPWDTPPLEATLRWMLSAPE